MQKKLKAAGYDLGSFGPEGDGIDGKWGKKTQTAYDAYMADKKLKQAGEPDAASRERERIAAQSNLQQAPKGSDTTTSGDSSSSTVSPSSNLDLSKEDPSVTAARAAAAEKLAQMQRYSDIAKAAREKPVSSIDQVGKTSPSANDNIDWKATAARDSLKNYEPYIPIKKSPTDSDDPIRDIIKQKQAEKVIPESVNTELNDILWLAGRHKR